MGCGQTRGVPGCKDMHYILENVSMAARMEEIVGVLKGDITVKM